MLHSLHLKNFMKHEDLEISFSPEATLIVGDNWAGKTTVFHGIRYLLFGAGAVEVPAKQLQRRGAKRKPEGTLVFSLGRDTYTVIRKATSAKLLKGQDPIASGPANVTIAVEALLNMPSRLFSDLRVSQQDEAAAILTLGVGRLNQIISQITKAELIDRVLERLGSKLQTLEAELGSLPEYDIQALQTQLKSQVEGLNSQYAVLSQATAEHAARQDILKQASQGLTELTARLQAAQEYQRAYGTLTAELGALNRELQAAQDGAAVAVPDVADLSAQYDKLYETVKNMEVAQLRKASHLAKLETLNTALEAQQAAVTERKQKLSQMTAPDTTALARITQEKLDAEVELGRLRGLATAAGKAFEESACPYCMRPFEGADVGGLKKKAEEADQASETQYALVQRLYSDAEAIGQSQQLYTAFEEALRNAEQAYEVTNAAKQDEEAGLAALPDVSHLPEQRKKREVADVQLREAFAIETAVNRAKQEAIRLSTEVSDTQRKLNNLHDVVPPTEPELNYAHMRLGQAQQELDTAASSVASLSTGYAVAYQQYTQAKQQLDSLVAMEERKAGKQKRLQLLQKLKLYLTHVKSDFIARTWDSILSYTSSFASKCTGGAIEQVKIVGGAKFEYLENGEQAPIVSASGFQRAVMGVGVRLALAEAVRAPVNFLLMDEVTAGATDENSMALSQALSEVGQQVVMISHRQADAAVAQKVVQL